MVKFCTWGEVQLLQLGNAIAIASFKIWRSYVLSVETKPRIEPAFSALEFFGGWMLYTSILESSIGASPFLLYNVDR